MSNVLNKCVSGKVDEHKKISQMSTFEPRHEISNNVVGATSKASDQPAHRCSLIRAFACCLIKESTQTLV